MAKNYSVNFKELQQALELIPEDKFPDIRKIKYALTFDGLNLSKPNKNESGIYCTAFWRNAEEEKMISIALTLLFISARNCFNFNKPSDLTNLSSIKIPDDDIKLFPITKKIHDFISSIEHKENETSYNLMNKLLKKSKAKKNEMRWMSSIFVKCPAEYFHIDYACKMNGTLSINGHGTMVLNDKNSESAIKSCLDSSDRKVGEIFDDIPEGYQTKHDYFSWSMNNRIKKNLNYNDLLEKSIEVKKGDLAVWNGTETPNPRVHSSPECVFTNTPSEDGNILASFIYFLKNNSSITSKNTLLLNLSKLKPDFVSQIESSRKLVSVLQTNIEDTDYVN